MVSWQDIRDNWPWIGSASTVLSITSFLVRKIGGPRKALIAFRSQWHLNLVILDLEDRLNREVAKVERAEKAERDANERTKEANQRAKEADQRTEDMATMTQTLLSAVSVVQEARDKGLLKTSTISLPPDTPPPATSTTSRTKHEAPLDLL